MHLIPLVIPNEQSPEPKQAHDDIEPLGLVLGKFSKVKNSDGALIGPLTPIL